MENLKQVFNQQGFVVYSKLFPKDVIAQIKSEITQVLDRTLLSTGVCLHENSIEKKMILLYQKDLQLYLGTIRALSRLFSIQQSFVSEQVQRLCRELGIVQPLIPTGPVFHVMSDQLKIPGGYFGQGVHQDWSSMQGSLNALVLWVALTEVSDHNYPVEVVPCSHLKGLIKGKITEHYFEVPEDMFEAEAFKPVSCQPGDALVFSSFLVHRSGMKGKSGFRLAVSFRFDDAAEEQLITRHYATAYKRSVDRNIKENDIPSVEQVQQKYI